MRSSQNREGDFLKLIISWFVEREKDLFFIGFPLLERRGVRWRVFAKYRGVKKSK